MPPLFFEEFFAIIIFMEVQPFTTVQPLTTDPNRQGILSSLRETEREIKHNEILINQNLGDGQRQEFLDGVLHAVRVFSKLTSGDLRSPDAITPKLMDSNLGLNELRQDSILGAFTRVQKSLLDLLLTLRAAFKIPNAESAQTKT